MKKYFPLSLQALGVSLSIFLIGCGGEEKRQSVGFRLPEGDIEVGKTTFVEKQCNRCHTVEGVTLPDLDLPALPKINLGGEIFKVKSYGELVTSIIKPQHVISPQYLKTISESEKERGVESPMPVFNEELTVKQLTDIVTFLDSRYSKIEPSSDPYFYVMP